MDWATQPDPFRRFPGTKLLRLPREEWRPEAGAAPAPLDRAFVDRLLFHSMALSAWKSVPGTSWSLRVNPSSGNLHPTEAYVLAGALEGLSDHPALYHYAPREHGLEQRARIDDAAWAEWTASLGGSALFVGLTSIHWREAWKYGERAFRYCQHDVGHAIAAVAYAAAALGWTVRLVDGVSDPELAELLGVSTQTGPEREHPDCLLLLVPRDARIESQRLVLPAAVRSTVTNTLAGEPNTLSASHHRWSVIDEIAEACSRRESEPLPRTQSPALELSGELFDCLRTRRSAVSMDRSTQLDRTAFYRVLESTLSESPHGPLGSLPWSPRIHLALFVHRVDGLAPGLYLLKRNDSVELESMLAEGAAWSRPEECPEHLPLFLLREADTRDVARATSCHQDIAADGCFAVAMLGEFGETIEAPGGFGPWFYRALHWEAGMIGQVLYLEAERAGVAGTGIGCFFDDETLRALGALDPERGRSLEVIYHFSVGGAVADDRIATLGAYHHLSGESPS